MTFEKLLEQLQALKITQQSMDWEECIPQEIYNEHFAGNFKTVDHFLYIDKHRWYEASITVIEIYGGFIGINHVTKLYSESNDIEDICFEISFRKMRPVKTTTYEMEK